MISKIVHRWIPCKLHVGDEARKMKVFHPDYCEDLEVFLKMVKDGTAIVIRDYTIVVHTFRHGGGHNIGLPLHQWPGCSSPVRLLFMMLLMLKILDVKCESATMVVVLVLVYVSPFRMVFEHTVLLWCQLCNASRTNVGYVRCVWWLKYYVCLCSMQILTNLLVAQTK